MSVRRRAGAAPTASTSTIGRRAVTSIVARRTVVKATAIIKTVSATAMSTVIPAISAPVVFVSLTCYIFYRQDSLIQFASIRRLLGLRSLFYRFELHKGVVALHIYTNKLSKRLKKKLKIFLTCRFFVKIHDKQSVRWLNVFATFVFLALNTAIASGKFDTESFRYVGDTPDVVGRNKQRRKKSQIDQDGISKNAARAGAHDEDGRLGEGWRWKSAKKDRRCASNLNGRMIDGY